MNIPPRSLWTWSEDSIPMPESPLPWWIATGHAVLGYDPAKDPVVSPYVRDYAQMILSCPQFIRDTEYTVFLGSGFASSASRGIFQNTALKRQGILLRDRLLTDDAVTYCYGATVKTE